MKENLKPYVYKQRTHYLKCYLVLFVERASELRYAARLSNFKLRSRRETESEQGGLVAWCRPETRRSIHEQVEAVVRHRGGPNHTYVEKCGDDLWIGEKFQSSLEIAGSPRNSFRASLDRRYAQVEH